MSCDPDLLFAHDLFRKPLSTFRGHALGAQIACPRSFSLQARPRAASRLWRLNLPNGAAASSSMRIPCRSIATCASLRSEERRVGKECRYRWAGENIKNSKERKRLD